MATPLLGPLTAIGAQASREATSAVGSLSNLIPSGWAAMAGLMLLLPVIGIFVRPFLRLGSAFTHSVSAIGSAALVCVSSWIVLVIHHLTALAHALRPHPSIEPFVRWGAVGGASLFLIHYFSIPLSYICALGVTALLVWAIRVYHPTRTVSLLRSRVTRRSGAIALGVVIVSIIACIAAYAFSVSGQSVHSCLVNGQIQQACVQSLGASKF